MIPLLTSAEMHELDRLAMTEFGLPGAVLMETAGRGVFQHLWQAFGGLASQGLTVVVCGKGNNGGDGFVVARCLCNRGREVVALLLGKRDEVRGEAAVHLTAYLAAGGRLLEATDGDGREAQEILHSAALVVDAILGTGLNADVRGAPAQAIGWLAAVSAPIVSVDLPSGVSSDTGRVCGAAIQAQLTVTFGWPKRGHYLCPGASRAGRLELVDIGIPPRALDRVAPGVYALQTEDLQGRLGRRREDHKGTFGHVVVLGGSPGKEGAAVLAASAALRAGAGLSTAAWPAGLSHGAAARLPPEVMNEALAGPVTLEDDWSEYLWPAAALLMDKADVLVVGPGMGAGEGPRGFLERLRGSDGPPLVLDADALNLVAASSEPWRAGSRPAVITPHPGEAARLLHTTSGAVQADRVGAARELAERYACVVILKGARTLVAAEGTAVRLIPGGNPGMATAGSGDVLAGAVGAALARGLPALEAAELAAFAHAAAGDLAAQEMGEEGMTAADILRCLPLALREIQTG